MSRGNLKGIVGQPPSFRGKILTYPQLWNELGKGDQKKVQIEEELELFIENNG